MARKSYRRAELEALLPRLENAGCPVAPKQEDDVSDLIKVTQDGGGLTLIGINNCGLTYGMLWVSISIRASQISVLEYKVSLPWSDAIFCLLEDPRERHASAQTYRFHGGDEFPRDLVLNHCLGRFTRGQCIAGGLMGVSLSRIPDQYGHGALVEATLSVITSLGECSTTIVAQIDRSRQFSPRKGSPRKPLFVQPDKPDADSPVDIHAEKRTTTHG